MASMSAKQTSCKQSGQRPLLFLFWTSVYGRKHWVSLSERHRWAERRESCFANRAQCRFAGLTISLAKRSDERGPCLHSWRSLVVVLSVSVRGCHTRWFERWRRKYRASKGFFFLFFFFLYIYTRIYRISRVWPNEQRWINWTSLKRRNCCNFFDLKKTRFPWWRTRRSSWTSSGTTTWYRRIDTRCGVRLQLTWADAACDLFRALLKGGAPRAAELAQTCGYVKRKLFFCCCSKISPRLTLLHLPPFIQK